MEAITWNSESLTLGRGRHLQIRYRSGQECWVQVGAAYWKDRYPGLERFHRSRGAEVRRGRVQEIQEDCYFKRYVNRSRGESLKALWRGSRGRRALAAGKWMELMGFGTPRVECLLEERFGPLLLGSALVTRELVETENCGEWFYFELGERVERWQLLRALGREVGRFHVAGIHHGDMRKTNILFSRLQNGDFRFYWLDNERNRVYKRLPESQRVHNLMQLNMDKRGISLTDRMRFWNAYLETAGVPPDKERALAQRVIAWTRKRWRKRGWL